MGSLPGAQKPASLFHSFIHSSDKYFLGTFYVSGTVLGDEDSALNKKEKNPVPRGALEKQAIDE